MKKFLTLLVSICMLFTLAACGSNTATDDTAADEPTAASRTYKLGMGVSLNDKEAEDGNAQIDATVAAVLLDEDGKIAACHIDAIQNKMNITDGTVDATKTFQTKRELGDNYNMVTYNPAAIGEWYSQANGFEAYVVGMTATEVAAIATTTNDEGNQMPTDEVLTASCTIAIDSFMDAVVKACNDDQAMEFTSIDAFGDLKLGIGVYSYVYGDKTADATADADGAVCMESDISAVVVDADGKIVACLTDSVQPVIAFSADGTLGELTYGGTKRELKEGYNMVAYNPSSLAEWYVQAQGFENYVLGMTGAEVAAIATETNAEGYDVATDEALLASCTINISGMKDTVAAACNYATNGYGY